jgi:outer membrane protein insertion porin family
MKKSVAVKKNDFLRPLPHRWLRVIIAVAGALIFASCSNLRYLEDNQVLFIGSNIEIESTDRIREKSRIESELSQVVRPEPNTTILGLRPWLWIYNIAGEPTGRGLRYFLRNRMGEPPVFLADADPSRTRRLMENRLVNLGYFDGAISFDINESNRRATIDYLVEIRRPYTIRNVLPAEGDKGIVLDINTSLDQTLLREGSVYRLELLREERERIDSYLKRIGYFFFNPDVILFHADSMVGDRQVDLLTTIKADIPAVATTQYRIGDISVFADYLLNPVGPGARTDTIFLDEGLFLFDGLNQYRRRIINQAIFLQKGEVYNVDEHNRTVNHLTSLGVFRFVNMRFIPRIDDGVHVLDVRILLSPMDRKSISGEVRGVTKSNNFAGPGVELAFSNRNFLGGAEDFRVSVMGSYETRFGRRDAAANAWEAGAEVFLSYPRFVLPFGMHRPVRVLSPKTNITAGLNYLSRTDAFELTTVSFNFGYSWNRDIVLHHRLLPIVINVFDLGRIFDESAAELIENIFLRRAFFEQFILGSEYSLVYNTQLAGITRNDYYFNLNFDTSGNLAWVVTNLAGGNPDEGLTIFNEPFAQFFITQLDMRYYRQLGSDSRLASRLILGAGFPYGNSERLPYQKQFVIGGTNSIRAFHPRTLGPGAFIPPEHLQGRFNLYQAGELKLEANLEYRYDITNIFKWAFFFDAGNVWRLREDEETPGGKFSADSFLEQIALGVGTGLRIDVSFFVLRFDFAIPLAIPYSEHPGFLDPIQPFRWPWLRNNLVFNLGIGYPF